MVEKACGVSRRLGQQGKGQSGNPLGRTMRQNMSKNVKTLVETKEGVAPMHR